jgi:hypothetical protein
VLIILQIWEHSVISLKYGITSLVFQKKKKKRYQYNLPKIIIYFFLLFGLQREEKGKKKMYGFTFTFMLLFFTLKFYN